MGVRGIPCIIAGLYTFCYNCGRGAYLSHISPLKAQSPMQNLFTGDIIESKYRVVRLLGEGGMNYVYLVESVKTAGLFAMKITKPPDAVDSDAVEIYNRFLREISILSTVNHPGLPHLEDYFTIDSCCYIVEQYIEGQTLEQVVQGGPQDEKEVVRWGIEICAILEALHKNDIIFRDLKPSNIIIDPSGKLKIIDFDIARRYVVGKASDTVSLGTPGYAAPETYGKAQSDARSDIYSLGATLHHLVSGVEPQCYPFKFIPLEQVKPQLNPDIAAVITRALSDDPRKRFTSAIDMRRDLEAIFPDLALDEEPQPPVSPSPSLAGAAAFRVPGAVVPATFNTSMNVIAPISRRILFKVAVIFFVIMALLVLRAIFFGDMNIQLLEKAPAGIRLSTPPAPEVKLHREWSHFRMTSETMAPPTYLYYRENIASPRMTIKQHRDERELFPHLDISFEFMVQGAGFANGPSPHELTFYVVVPSDDSYLLGSGKFSTIPGKIRRFTLKDEYSWTAVGNKVLFSAGEKNSVMKGSIDWFPRWDEPQIRYSPDKPWLGPRVLLVLRSPDYSWEYTRGFFIKQPL